MATKPANALAHIEPDVKQQIKIIVVRDEMDVALNDAMMSEGLSQAKAGQGFPMNKACSLLHRDV